MADGGSGKVPVGRSVAAAWGFFLRNWMRLIPAAMAPAIANGLARLLIGSDLAEATADPATMFAAQAIAGAGNILFAAAVLRLAVRGDFVRPTGVAFGADELRLLGANITSGIIIAAPLFAAYAAIVYPVFGKLFVSPVEFERVFSSPEEIQKIGVDEGVLGLSSTISVVCMGLLIWAAVRLFMASAATIGERRVVVLQSWGWSRDNFWRVLACLLLSLLGLIPAALVNDVIVALALPFAKANAQTVLVLATAAMGFVSAMAAIPVHAMAAHLYKGLRPADFAAR